jgi:hypothetical protein
MSLPFRCEFDGDRNTITVDGVVISLEVLRTLANPDPRVTYRMERTGNVVTIHQLIEPPC